MHEVNLTDGHRAFLVVGYAAAREAQRVLGRPLGSHTLVAGPVDWRAPSEALSGR